MICLLNRLLSVTSCSSSKQRNSHWRVQSVVSPPQAMKNGSGPVSSYPGKLEENSTGTTSNMLASSQNTAEIDPGRDLTSKFMVQQSEVAKQAMHVLFLYLSQSKVTMRFPIICRDHFQMLNRWSALQTLHLVSRKIWLLKGGRSAFQVFTLKGEYKSVSFIYIFIKDGSYLPAISVCRFSQHSDVHGGRFFCSHDQFSLFMSRNCWIFITQYIWLNLTSNLHKRNLLWFVLPIL